MNGKPIEIAVNGSDAPITAGNFLDLVDQQVYNGTRFHRVVRQPRPFVVQGGDPLSKDPNVPPSQFGTGGFIDPETKQPRDIPLEILPEGAQEATYGQTLAAAGVTQPPKLKHTRGAVAMARSQLPDSASSQFYIALDDLPDLDGSYAVFGYVTAGMDVVDGIQQGDQLSSAQIKQGTAKSQALSSFHAGGGDRDGGCVCLGCNPAPELENGSFRGTLELHTISPLPRFLPSPSRSFATGLVGSSRSYRRRSQQQWPMPN